MITLGGRSGAVEAARGQKAALRDREKVLGWLMLGPAVIYILAFVGIPFILAILLSFSDATIGNPTPSHFVGLANYIRVVGEPQFITALRNSIIITGATLVVLLVLTVIESELLARNFRGKRLVQALLILPWAMPVALATITWLWFLDSQFSPLDWIFVQLHILGPGGLFGPYRHFYYYGRTGLAIASIVAINVWRLLPLATLIVLAGRLSIPRDRFEQAAIDGAGFFRILFRITIPALAPVLTVATLFTGLLVIGNMAIVALTTHGGPGTSSQILPYWAYLQGIEGGDLSGGAAVALFLLPFLAVVTVITLRFAYRAQET
jgi:multiple sugar transport system permease protein